MAEIMLRRPNKDGSWFYLHIKAPDKEIDQLFLSLSELGYEPYFWTKD